MEYRLWIQRLEGASGSKAKEAALRAAEAEAEGEEMRERVEMLAKTLASLQVGLPPPPLMHAAPSRSLCHPQQSRV